MSVFKKLFGNTSSFGSSSRSYTFAVKCLRCGETIEGHVDLNNDLSVEYDEDRDVYHARKVLMGSGKCFQRIETTFKFDSERKLLERQITGGEFI